MPGLEEFSPKGMLHKGWSAQVDDYAIVCGWALKGKAFLVGDVAGGLYSFEGKSGNLIWQTKEIHKGGLLAMSIHPDGNTFATAGQDGKVLIWESKEGKSTNTLELGKGWVEHIKWSPDGKLLAATACYGQVTFFDVASNKVNQKLEWRGSLVSMVLSPDGDIVACGSQDNSVHFWRRSTDQDSEMTGYPGKPSHLAFDQTGTVLATGGSDRVTVWSFQGDGPEGTVPGELILHTEPISCLAFSHSGMLLASGARDGSVFSWFLQKDGQGDPVGGAFAGDLVSKIAWRPDDCALAAVNANGGITVWDFKVRNKQAPKGFS